MMTIEDESMIVLPALKKVLRQRTMHHYDTGSLPPTVTQARSLEIYGVIVLINTTDTKTDGNTAGVIQFDQFTVEGVTQ